MILSLAEVKTAQISQATSCQCCHRKVLSKFCTSDLYFNLEFFLHKRIAKVLFAEPFWVFVNYKLFISFRANRWCLENLGKYEVRSLEWGIRIDWPIRRTWYNKQVPARWIGGCMTDECLKLLKKKKKKKKKIKRRKPKQNKQQNTVNPNWC